MTPTPDSLAATLDRLRRMRHGLIQTVPPPSPDGSSLVPILNRSAEVCAIDVAIRLLERELRAVAS